MDKQKQLQFLIDQQKIAIEELRNSMEDFKAYSDLDEGETHDPEDFSNQTVAKESQLRLEQQLSRAENDLELLERFAGENYDSVQSGALIETDKDWFLAGISMGGFDSSKTDILCISTGSPAFKTLLGKKEGDSFTLGGNTYLIKAIG